MRALIADDEAPARAKLRRLLESAADVEITSEAATGREAVAAIKRDRPDVVFLDVQMPGLDGFGVLDALENDGAPYTVFVTANEQHALRAFEAGAVDYLLKPYTPERFATVLQRARDRLAASLANHAPREARARNASFLTRLLIVDNGRAVLLAVDRIDRIESERNYVLITSGRVQYRLRATIASLNERLDPAHFLRINRSTVVRLDAIREMQEWSHGDFRVVMHDGTELIWSRRYRASVASTFSVGR
jgi:two-component system LytT family response regulator